MDLLARVRSFAGEESHQRCRHKHRLAGTGIFFQSVGLIQCARCKGWQGIREPIK